MQITSYYPNISINTANPPTELARRDMQRRELVEPVREMDKGKPERAVATEEKGRSSNSGSSVSSYDASGKSNETQQAIEGRPEQSEDSSRQQQNDAEQRQQQAEQKEIKELQSRDQEVRSHEQAHASIGGRYAGAPSYTYELGPDGRQYAVAGEVQIDIAPIAGDPQATIQKMQQVKAAALAPAEPSSADRRIAAEASQRLLQAQTELVAEKTAPAETKPLAQSDAAAQAGAAIDNSQIRYDSETISNTGSVAGLVFPEFDTLAKMQQRSQVISRFYQLATEPAQRPLRQQA